MLGLWSWVACGSPALEPPPIAPAASPTPPPCERAAFAVALDIGHAPDEPGATSARGRTEHTFNRDLAVDLLQALHASGFTGSFTVDPARERLSLTDRPARAAAGGAAVLLSLHHDSVQPHYLRSWEHPGGTGQHADNFSGFSLWVSLGAATATENRALGQALGAALLAAGHSPTLHHAEDVAGERREVLDPDVGLYRRDTLAVLRVSTIPTVLVEGGVIVNRAEELRLRDSAWRQGFSSALIAGVEDYCAAATGSGPSP